MSISSSTIVDWHNLQRGRQLKGYSSWLSGMNERGMDHRKLDAWYYQLAGEQNTAHDYTLLTRHMDPVERTPISYDMEAFTKIIAIGGDINRPMTIPDQVLQGVTHNIKLGEMPRVTICKLFGYKNSLAVSRNSSAHNQLIIHALKNSGSVFAGIRVRLQPAAEWSPMIPQQNFPCQRCPDMVWLSLATSGKENDTILFIERHLETLTTPVKRAAPPIAHTLYTHSMRRMHFHQNDVANS